ncbi:MAG: dihydroorotate dehydrogenase [Candidatus Aminicenantes bacterium]|nr:dihydroorotate dehydrogenase [Candidatus Aminicenantes bacterium]MDH5705885.1 dihydroorotate dehydrogenase [Candidatus Aminicenantes bacterium]
MTDLSVDLGFIKLKNPVIAASGTFGYGLEFEPFIDLNLLGGFVVKGLYFSPREGNAPPRLAEASSGLINAIGLPGIGVERFSEEVLPRIRKYDTAIIVNVCGESEEEYGSVVEFLDKKEGISAYELNISCPNVKKDGLCPALSPEATFSAVSLVRKISSRPLITKLSPNVTDILEIALSAQEAGSDAISLVNTFLALAVDTETRRPKLANVYGGLSGPAIKPIALRMVHQVASRVNIPVIGMGGILEGNDALEFLIAGAKAVEVGTANFVDPEATKRIIDELNGYCQKMGIDRIETLIGSLRT